MTDILFDKATVAERDALALLRAGAWAGKISVEQFAERNRRLYQHEFGRKRIHTFVLRNHRGKIVSSMDSLSVSLLVKLKANEVSTIERGFLIASVITPTEERGKGYATRLLNGYFKIQPPVAGVLYSDIGPEFYERYGFRENPGWLKEDLAAESLRSFEAKPIGLDEFVSSLIAWRREKLELQDVGAGCLSPDLLFLDWQLERFRYFSEAAGQSLLKPFSFELKCHDSAHHCLFVPNLLTGKMEVLWREMGCANCLEFIAHQAKLLGSKSFYHWDNRPSANALKQECPMIYIQGFSDAHCATPAYFFDPQLCDWW